MTYEQAIAWLGSLEVLGIRPGLDRIDALLERLGRPERSFPSVLVAGTNGKGSVTAFLASILGQAGIVPGVYTSPHLVRFEERIAVGRDPIDASDVPPLVAEVRGAAERDPHLRTDPPTYFEATTALAFLHFSRRRAPIAVLEVGMGGRFDATNVVAPAACAITRIALDHTLWLGRSLREIASQKAGILRAGVPAVVSPGAPQALEAIHAEAERVGAPLFLTGDCEVVPAAPPGAGGAGPRFSDPPVFSLTTPAGGRYRGLSPSLRGAHQVENAVAAVLLAERLAAAGFAGLGPSAIAAGIHGAVWPGRLERIPDRPELLLDGAHNPDGCAALAAYLRDHQPGRPIVLVFAAMKDKPAGEMLDLLAPLAARVILAPLPVPRGESPETLHRLAAARHPDARPAGSVDEALRLARAGTPDGGLIVVSGSLYLVGEVRRLIPTRAAPLS